MSLSLLYVSYRQCDANRCWLSWCLCCFCQLVVGLEILYPRTDLNRRTRGLNVTANSRKLTVESLQLIAASKNNPHNGDEWEQRRKKTHRTREKQIHHDFHSGIGRFWGYCKSDFHFHRLTFSPFVHGWVRRKQSVAPVRMPSRTRCWFELAPMFLLFPASPQTHPLW